MKFNTKQLTTLAMLIAMAFTVGATLRIKGAFAAMPFLTYDPKDVVILIGGFMFGPLSALIMSVTVALIEMITISDTGFIGAFMNAISSATLTCTAAFVYSKRRNMQGAVAGLVLGCVVATTTMLLWNYLIIPIYSPFVTREAVIGLIIPALLPFNLIKTSLNSVLAILLYKRVSVALSAVGLYKETALQNKGKNMQIAVILVAVILIALLFIFRSIG